VNNLLFYLLNSIKHSFENKEWKIGTDALWIVELLSQLKNKSKIKFTVELAEQDKKYDIVIITQNKHLIHQGLFILTTLPEIKLYTAKPVITISPKELSVSMLNYIFALLLFQSKDTHQ